MGKLGDGEFDFSKPPGLGGAEDPGAAPHTLDFDLAGNIAGLRDQFAQQDTQLSVLENLLLDRKLQSTLVPTGYPVANSYIGSGFGERVDVRSTVKPSITWAWISMPKQAATSRLSPAVW